MTLPLTDATMDLRDFAFMPLDVVRLRDSDLAARASAEEFRCAVLLWCASWHQTPPASLPDDDAVLSNLAGFGRSVKEWAKHRAGALHGWIKCEDGRLYHPVVADKATEAWRSKLRQRDRTAAAREAKLSQRGKPSVTENVTGSKGQGQGTNTVSKEGNGRPEPPIDPDAELFRRGKAILGQSAGGQIKKIKDLFFGDVAKTRAFLEDASSKENPAEYVAAAIKRHTAKASSPFDNVTWAQTA